MPAPPSMVSVASMAAMAAPPAMTAPPVGKWRRAVADSLGRVPDAAWDGRGVVCDSGRAGRDISKKRYSESPDKECTVLLLSDPSSPADRVRKAPCKCIDVAENGVGAGNVKYFSPYEHLMSPTSANVTSLDDDSVSFDIVSNIRRKENMKQPYLKFLCPPYFILAASLVEISVFIWGGSTQELLMYSPDHRQQVWRFLSYMLIHSGSVHLTLNIIIQTLLATPLELEQGAWRCAVVYVGGGLAGALGASVLQPIPMVGASAGVYALLMSHLANVILGYSTIRYKIFRVFAVSVLAISDVACYVAHWWYADDSSPRIGWAAHCAGAAAGAALGMLVYKGSDRQNTYIKTAIWISLAVLVTGIIICLFFNVFVL